MTQQHQLGADIRQDYIRRIGHDIEYPKPVTLKAAQKALPKGVLALAYIVDDDSAHLFALTNSSFKDYSLPFTQKSLHSRVTEARKVLTDIHSVPKVYERVLKGLYHDLLAPAQEKIAQARSLLICPDGDLNRLPFAALMPRTGHYLIQDKPITMSASLTIYNSLRSQPHPPLTSLLALGDPDYSMDDARPLPNPAVGMSQKAAEAKTADPKSLGATAVKPTWERLTETGTLAQEIKAQYAPHAQVLLRKQATAANFLAKSGQASILHIGCHGVADDRNPFSSWLALAPASRNDDGRLSAWQLLHRRLNARLVVLWGCGTGLGIESHYEGVLGLPRAFQIAGAQNVLTTLWEVHPAETLQIFRDFYHLCKATSQEKPLAEALREAQIKAIKADPRPYFWASFVLDGVGE